MATTVEFTSSGPQAQSISSSTISFTTGASTPTDASSTSIVSLTTPTLTSAPSPSSSAGAANGHPNTTLTTLVALGCALFFLAYLCGITLTWRYLRNHPRPVNKKSGDLVSRWAPAFYMGVVLVSLIEVSLASWLVLEYVYYYDAPNQQAFAAASFFIFDSAWTALTSGIYSILFLHPSWFLLPIASIGAQWVWLLVTWLLWIIAAGLLNGALPELIDERKCEIGVVFCKQIQGLFALAVIQIIILTGGMLALIWLIIGMSGAELGSNDAYDVSLKKAKSSSV